MKERAFKALLCQNVLRKSFSSKDFMSTKSAKQQAYFFIFEFLHGP